MSALVIWTCADCARQVQVTPNHVNSMSLLPPLWFMSVLNRKECAARCDRCVGRTLARLDRTAESEALFQRAIKRTLRCKSHEARTLAHHWKRGLYAKAERHVDSEQLTLGVAG